MQAAEPTEFSESATVTFEWTVKNLKSLFDASKGDLKSKVAKSVKFGGGCVVAHSISSTFPMLILVSEGPQTVAGAVLSKQVWLECIVPKRRVYLSLPL